MEKSLINRNIRRIFHQDRRNGNPKSLIWARKLGKIQSAENLKAFQERLRAFYRAKNMPPPRPISRSKRREPPAQKWERFKKARQEEANNKPDTTAT